MHRISAELFAQVVQQAHFSLRFKRGLRFTAGTANFDDQAWLERELLAVADQSGSQGLLFVQPYNQLFVLPYQLQGGLSDPRTGRAAPIICDFCRTWQAGSQAARITFLLDRKALHTASFLCCADIACSLHVRNKTLAAKTSRVQLHEDMTVQQRIQRLERQLQQLIDQLHPLPVDNIKILG